MGSFTPVSCWAHLRLGALSFFEDIKFDNIMFCGSQVPAGASLIEIDEANIFNGRYKLADFGSGMSVSRVWRRSLCFCLKQTGRRISGPV